MISPPSTLPVFFCKQGKQDYNSKQGYSVAHLNSFANAIFKTTVEPRYKEVGYNKTLL